MMAPQTKRTLVVIALVIGAFGVYSLLMNNPGDFFGGLVGAVICGAAAGFVMLVEALVRWLSRWGRK